MKPGLEKGNVKILFLPPNTTPDAESVKLLENSKWITGKYVLPCDVMPLSMAKVIARLNDSKLQRGIGH